MSGWKAHRTVLACSSMGAPEITAAGVVSPGSLPSITLVGTGEKLLVELARFKIKYFRPPAAYDVR